MHPLEMSPSPLENHDLRYQTPVEEDVTASNFTSHTFNAEMAISTKESLTMSPEVHWHVNKMAADFLNEFYESEPVSVYLNPDKCGHPLSSVSTSPSLASLSPSPLILSPLSSGFISKTVFSVKPHFTAFDHF